MLIKKICLENFLSYGHKVEVPFGSLNVIIGANGTGKSNLIEALDFLHNAPTELLKPIREGGGISDWLWKGSDVTPVASIETVFKYNELKTIKHVLSFTSVQQRFEITDERIEDEKPVTDRYDQPYFYYHFNKGHPYLNVVDKKNKLKKRYLNSEDIDLEKSILSQRKDPDLYPEITWIGRQLDEIQIYRNWNFGRYTAPRLPQKVDLPNKYLLPDCSNLGLILNKFNMNVKAKNELLAALKDLDPNIIDYVLQIEGGTAQLFLQENDFTIPATRLSDGTLRFLCLAAILCNPNPPPLVCIEEPELGLHPDVIPTVAELLKKASERTQLVVTTHSASLVDCFTDNPETVLVSEKDETGTTLRRLDKNELSPWLEKYRLGKLWMQGEIGGTRW